eukprot:1709405-Rhodomonas_salina.1
MTQRQSMQQRRGEVWGPLGDSLSTGCLPYADFVSMCQKQGTLDAESTRERKHQSGIRAAHGSAVAKSVHLLLLSRWKETRAVTQRSTEATAGPMWRETRFRLCSACNLLDNVASLCGPLGALICELKAHIYQVRM